MTEKIYSVSQVNSYIKGMFAKDSALSRISVQGEVSNCKYHTSGHLYFTLKDGGGTLSAVMFASRRGGLTFALKDGQQIVVTGSIEVYEKGGSYQIYASEIKQAGLGDLYEKFLKLKADLAEMGMFSEEYKKPIPKVAKTIGIATAKTGAAIQDIINVTKRRNPYVQLVFIPTKVQGKGAAKDIARNIKVLDDYGVDVIIVGRGGGSLEDLWAFNEEIVARAIFNSHTPVISAVGHETDFTIADYVADLRAPTPSAAAELATVDVIELINSLDRRKEYLKKALVSNIDFYRQKSERQLFRLSRVSPMSILNSYKMQSEEARLRMLGALKSTLVETKHKLIVRSERLKGLSPLDKISNGYAWISDCNDKHITKVKDIKPKDDVTIRFADGRAIAKVTEVINE